jgi:hypothetical protein
MHHTKVFLTLALTMACWLGAAMLAKADDTQKPVPAGAISGKVVDKDGVAVEGATVTARVPPPPGERGSKWKVDVTTDKDGAFKIMGLIDETYTLIVEKNDLRGEMFAVKVANGKETVLKAPITVLELKH